MRRLVAIATSILLGGLIPAEAGIGKQDGWLNDLTLAQLETRRNEIDSELEQLASLTARGGTGALGYRSEKYPQPDITERIRIELGKEVAIDEVVLVPVLYRGVESGLRSGGFPTVFRVLAGTAHTTNVVASFSAEDQLLPRIAPLAVPFQPVTASWVALEASTLPPMLDAPDKYMLELAEIMVFSGKENVALPLQRPLTAPPAAISPIRPRTERFLTDGFTPFLMNAAQGSSSRSRILRLEPPNLPPTLTIDLKASQPV